MTLLSTFRISLTFHRTNTWLTRNKVQAKQVPWAPEERAYSDPSVNVVINQEAAEHMPPSVTIAEVIDTLKDICKLSAILIGKPLHWASCSKDEILIE